MLGTRLCCAVSVEFQSAAGKTVVAAVAAAAAAAAYPPAANFLLPLVTARNRFHTPTLQLQTPVC